MRLNDRLITSFLYNEREYAIDLAFDNVLDVFDVIKDKDLRDYEKADICLELLLNESFKGMEAINIWNYVYEEFIEFKSKQAIEYDLKGNPMPTKEEEESEQYIDIEQDAEYIYSSFIQAYNINLFEQQGKMQWIQFKALLNGLPSNTIMQRIVQIRSWEPSKHDSAKEKENMRKLQKIYALKEVDE